MTQPLAFIIQRLSHNSKSQKDPREPPEASVDESKLDGQWPDLTGGSFIGAGFCSWIESLCCQLPGERGST